MTRQVSSRCRYGNRPIVAISSYSTQTSMHLCTLYVVLGMLCQLTLATIGLWKAQDGGSTNKPRFIIDIARKCIVVHHSSLIQSTKPLCEPIYEVNWITLFSTWHPWSIQWMTSSSISITSMSWNARDQEWKYDATRDFPLAGQQVLYPLSPLSKKKRLILEKAKGKVHGSSSSLSDMEHWVLKNKNTDVSTFSKLKQFMRRQVLELTEIQKQCFDIQDTRLERYKFGPTLCFFACDELQTILPKAVLNRMHCGKDSHALTQAMNNYMRQIFKDQQDPWKKLRSNSRSFNDHHDDTTVDAAISF